MSGVLETAKSSREQGCSVDPRSWVRGLGRQRQGGDEGRIPQLVREHRISGKNQRLTAERRDALAGYAGTCQRQNGCERDGSGRKLDMPSRKLAVRNNVDSRLADEVAGGDGQGAPSVLTRTRSRSGSLNRASRLDPMRQMRIPDTLNEHHYHCLGVTAGMTKTALRRALCRSPSQRERLSGLFQQIDIRAPSEACQSTSRTLASTQRGRR